jgi:hypothetical protein
MSTYRPYRGNPPYQKNSDTSLSASESMKQTAPVIRERVFSLIKIAPAGLTCDHIENWLGLRHQTCSARVRELVLKGRIHDSGRRRRTSSGRTATVWEINPGQ